jgi:hypothetical protein
MERIGMLRLKFCCICISQDEIMFLKSRAI